MNSRVGKYTILYEVISPFVMSGGCQETNISVGVLAYALTFFGFPGVRVLPPGLLVGIGVVVTTAKDDTGGCYNKCYFGKKSCSTIQNQFYFEEWGSNMVAKIMRFLDEKPSNCQKHPLRKIKTTKNPLIVRSTL